MIGLLFLLIFFTAVKRTYSLPYMEGPNASRASISSYRVVMMFITCLCILAVDFRIYPREYAKTETYVTSLVWQVLLAVRALVLPPTEDIETWLKFASLCRKNGRISQARSTLIKLLQYDPEASPENVRYHGPPQVMLAYLKYQWSLGDDHKRKEAFARLQNTFIQDGKEMASVLYTYRSCVKALPQGVCWNSQFGIQKLAAETGAASIYCGFWF
ncbi:hypothetical protein V6Z12_A02G145200 [Gossypium hirsutum]|uniref:Serine/threonine-protein kinase TOR isoform X2 n=2 Tax=Gossypium TaxID=3633 RepID=A0A1U8NTE3_GOSHI|nr:serine/threonine-protein kinase TOR-like isoform X2 [Gossypium hirsutum]TYH28454.1 hypothetical protein ES288_A02G144400v1 [Gossypium darwinii]